MKECTILSSQKRKAVSKPFFKGSLESDIAGSRRIKHFEFDQQKQNKKEYQKYCIHIFICQRDSPLLYKSKVFYYVLTVKLTIKTTFKI